MDKPVIALDLDGCFVDLLGTAVRKCRIPMPFDGYDGTPRYAIREWNLSKEQIKAISAAMYDPTTVLEADPIDGALDAWAILGRLGDLYVVTARADRYRTATLQWLARHELSPKGVMFTPDKGKAALEIGASIAFEDSPRHVAQLVAAEVPHIFIPAYPYTRFCPGNRYESWAHCFSMQPLAGLLDEAIRGEAA